MERRRGRLVSFSRRAEATAEWFPVPRRERATIVNNESSEIFRMFGSERDAVAASPEFDFRPEALLGGIDATNALVCPNANDGGCRCRFATAREAHEEAFGDLFRSLDERERRLGRQRYPVGDRITEADGRLHHPPPSRRTPSRSSPISPTPTPPGWSISDPRDASRHGSVDLGLSASSGTRRVARRRVPPSRARPPGRPRVDAPQGRVSETRPGGGPATVTALRRVGGLHHRYTWRQAAQAPDGSSRTDRLDRIDAALERSPSKKRGARSHGEPARRRSRE